MIIIMNIFFALQTLYYWVKSYNNGELVKIIGDIIYGIGIGVAGNGLYDLLNTGACDMFTVFVGTLAIIVGAILRK